MLTILGGTYFEKCIDPDYHELVGSGLRAATALSDNVKDIHFVSCISKDNLENAKSICNTFTIKASFQEIDETVTFFYDHPLSHPEFYPNVINSKIDLPPVKAENILYYGLIEAKASVHGSYVVYDPQNEIPYRNTGSTAEHLALILNKREAQLLSGCQEDEDLESIGKSLLSSEGAEVIVIKNGSNGALVVENKGTTKIPVFETYSVWPIGSGDIFSAVFAWKWMLEKLPAAEAALFSSRFTAEYCESKQLPLLASPRNLNPLPGHNEPRKIYLAGPFFNISQRWLINELRNLLFEFGNIVFSPFHDVKQGSSKSIADQDLHALRESNLILAIVSGLDAGTLFEIGYARALNKKVIVFAENVSDEDLTMLAGSDCEICNDFTTAVYKASW